MKKINSFLQFGITVFFITNVWIIIYKLALPYLNALFPHISNEQFLRNIATPQPFQISLYIALAFIFIPIIWLTYQFLIRRKADHIWAKKSPFAVYLKCTVFILLLLFFVWQIGEYPLSHDIYPYVMRSNSSIYNIIAAGYICISGFLILELSLLYHIKGKVKIVSRIVYLLVLIIISAITFEPQFPIIAHDYSFFIGPILEIANGKTIYTDIPTQHGFLSILLLSSLYKLKVLDLTNLPILIWLGYTLQYFLSYLFLFKISKSTAYSLIGLFSIITINYFSLFHLPSSLPQSGPMRWLPSLLIFGLLLKHKKIHSSFFIFFIVISSLWIIDVGIFIVMAFFLTLFVLFLGKQINLKEACICAIKFVGIYIFVLVCINLLHLLLGYKSIDFVSTITKIRYYAAEGIAQQPIEQRTYFWIVLLVYFSQLLYFFQKQKKEYIDNAMIFLSNIILFSSIYYVGRGHPHNLFHIAGLTIFGVFAVFAVEFRKMSLNWYRLLFLLTVFVLFVVYPLLQRKITISEMIVIKYKNFTSGKIFQPQMKEIVSKKYESEAKLINEKIRDNKILILSVDDSYLFYLTKKENLFDANPQVGIDTRSELNKALQNVLQTCPMDIVGDCRLFDECVSNNTYNHGFFVSPFILEEIETACKLKYKPTFCTRQLCVASAQK